MGDTKVLCRYGTYKRIDELNREDHVLTLDLASHTLKDTEIVHFLKRDREKIYKITTETGEEVKATEDHPFLTKQGMIKIKDIKIGDFVAVNHFKGVRYEKPSNEVIIDVSDIKKIVGNREKIIKELKKRELLPLRMNSQKFPILARLVGYLTGDGHISKCYNKKRGLHYWMIHAIDSVDTLKNVAKDVKKLGFKPWKIIEIESKSKIDHIGREERIVEGVSHQLVIPASSLAVLMIALGVPQGRKSKKRVNVPKWVKSAPKWIKRLYLAGLFGAELTKPIQAGNYGFKVVLYQYKKEDLVSNGFKFLKDLKELLSDFGVKCTIGREKGGEIITKAGEKSIKLVLRISTKLDSMINLLEKIGYEYKEERRRLGSQVLAYLKFKKHYLGKKREAIEKALKLRKEGMKIKNILEKFNKKILNRGILADRLYEDVEGVRIYKGFPYPKSFLSSRRTNPPSEIVWVRVEGKELINKKCPVYDITVNHKDHNFIANSFVVSNCGVRLAVTNLKVDDVRPKIKLLADTLFKNIPSGLGSRGKIKVSRSTLDEVLKLGAKWAVENGYGWEEDLERLEENGQMETADPNLVSDRAKQRGMPQLGSLGSGNHFLEIQRVDKIFNTEVAKVFGIEQEGQVCVMIHSGSRGLGHQVCSDYLREIERRHKDIVRTLPDRELIYAPAGSEMADRYFKAMSAAVNYAFCNRQMILHWARESFERIFNKSAEDLGMHLVYGVAHNICKIEEHEINGEKKKVFLHRKGGTRAFPPGHPDVPKVYRKIGQPVLIPGTMGTASYVLVGAETGKETFYSTAHGAGRVVSRHKAKKRWWGSAVKRKLWEEQKIYVKSASGATLAEECSEAYKNIHEVCEVSDKAGIGNLVARLRPLGCVKG